MASTLPQPAAPTPSAPSLASFASEFSLRDYYLPGAIALGILAALFATTPNFRWTSGPQASPYAGDFLQEWVGGKVAREGDHGRFYDPQYARECEHDPSLVPQEWKEDEYLPLVYPPFYYLLISPLAHLPLVAAAWVWAALMTACLAGALALLVRTSGVLPSGEVADGSLPSAATAGCRYYLPWLLPAAVLFAPVLESLASSQKGTLLLLIFSATYALLRSERPFLAGLVFGLLAFKPQLGLVVGAAMLWRGEWRFVLGAAITVAAAVGWSLTLGWDVCLQYAEFLRGGANYMATPGYDLAKAHTWLGFFALLTGEPTGLLARSLACVALLATIGVVLGMLRESPSFGSLRFAQQYAALVVASILASPHFFTYDLTILLLPMTVLGAQLLSQEPAERPGWAWIVPALYVVPSISVSLAGSIGWQISVPLMAALVVGLAVAASAWSDAPPSASVAVSLRDAG